MYIYILSMAMVPMLGLLKGKYGKLGVVLNGLQLFAILALRDTTMGVDLLNYEGGYAFISTLSFDNLVSRLHIFQVADLVYPYAFESGYCVMNWLCSKLGLSFHGFLVVCAAISIISITRFIIKHSLNTWLSFSMFIGLGMYEYCFGIIRQTLAVAILLYAYDYILENKPKRFFLLVVLAFTIHRVAILFCILYIFSKVKITRKKMIVYLGGCLAFLFFSTFFFTSILTNILEKLGKSTYTSAKFTVNNQILLMVSIAIIILLFVNFDVFLDKNLNTLMWSFLLSIPIEIIGMNNDGFARAVEIFFISVIVLIPNIVALYGRRNVEENSTLIIRLDTSTLVTGVIYLLMFGLMIYLMKDSFVVPYVWYKI